MPLCLTCIELQASYEKATKRETQWQLRKPQSFTPDCDLCTILEGIISAWDIHLQGTREVLARIKGEDYSPLDLKLSISIVVGGYHLGCKPGLAFPITLFSPLGGSNDRIERHAAEVRDLGWIDRCRSQHGCGNWMPNPLPTRLVDVRRSDDDIRLAVPGPTRGRYLCLSHCWGNLQLLRLERATLRAFVEHIPCERLSKTFREAIQFTRRLGLRYIWIDSLCILQDDHEDWARESARMGDVYKYSYLTLAATAGPDGGHGLATQKIPGCVTTDQIGDHWCTIYVRKPIDHASKWEPNKSRSSYPLLSRAWVFQERCLSSRVLHFSRDELFWECNQETLCECGENARIKLKKANHLAAPKDASDFGSPHKWRDMIEEYTTMALTRPSDKLPAIAGLSCEIGKERPAARYLAGIWSDSLQLDLLWVAWEDEYHAATASYRRNQWRAPSWSWASLDAEIIWPQSEYSCTRANGSETRLFFQATVLGQYDLTALGSGAGPDIATLELSGETLVGRLNLGHEWDSFLFDAQDHVRFRSYGGDKGRLLQVDDREELLHSSSDVEAIDVLCMKMGTVTSNEDYTGKVEAEYTMVLLCMDIAAMKYRRVGMGVHSRNMKYLGSAEEVASWWEGGGIWQTIYVV